jgi:hypothetical protein
MIYNLKLTFTEDLLGTVPLNKNIYADYIAGKEEAPPEAMAEVDTVIEVDDKGKTGFHRLPDGTPFLYDYVIKGYLKDACGMISRMDDSLAKKVKAYKKVIDGLVFVEPRQIPFVLSGEIGENTRPLRAETAQGPRIALACSETVPAGSRISFDLLVLADKIVPEELVRELFFYGRYRGLGQWRNASYGRFLCNIDIAAPATQEPATQPQSKAVPLMATA